MSFGRKISPASFTLNIEQVEIVDNFKYLGVAFSRNERFITAIKENMEKGRLAMYCLRRTITEKKIPLDCQIDLFQKMIEPILLYGSEIWGFENTAMLETFRLKTIKQLLGLKMSTPSYMVYGETGLLPLESTIKKRMIAYWSRLVCGKKEKTSLQLMNIMINDNTQNSTNYKWLKKTKMILDNTGFTYLWQQQISSPQHLNAIKRTITDQELQHLDALCENSTKGKIYKNANITWDMNYYLKNLQHKNTISILKFRTANNKFPVETGRYNATPYNERKCPYCVNMIGDEYHYLLECKQFERQRKKLINKTYYTHPSMIKYQALLNSTDILELNKLSRFVNILMTAFK